MGLPREGNTLSDTSDALQQTETAAKPTEDPISAPLVELASRYGLTLHVSEEYADHFDVDVGSYLFPCPYTDGWPGYEESDGKVIFSNTAFVFSDPDNATGTSGREGLVWCIYAIPMDEYTPINDPASSGMFYDINSRLLGQNEEYAFILVFPSYALQCNQQSLESVTSYWRHMCQGYEVLKNAVESYGFDNSPDWLDNYEQYINLLDAERKNLENQQAGKSDKVQEEEQDSDGSQKFVGSFGLAWDYVEEPRFPTRPVFKGYTETWTEEQIYAYASENLLSLLDDYYEGSRERTTYGDHTVLLYQDGTVSSGVSFSYVIPHDDGATYEMLVVVNHDRMDEEMEARYLIGEPNNEIGGIPVWLGWTYAESGVHEDTFISTDYILMAAFEYDGTYYFLRQSTGADGFFLGAVQTDNSGNLLDCA